MASFLIYVPVADAALGEAILKSAVSFLEVHGAVEVVDLGHWRRPARKNESVESLALVRLKMAVDVAPSDAASRAQALEGVLRATLASAGAHAGDARVFAEASP